MRRRKFRYRVLIPFESYHGERNGIWDWLEATVGRVLSEQNPYGQWTGGFSKDLVLGVESYEFTFEDRRTAMLFKLLWDH